MAANYANAIPTDERGNPMQGLPPPVIASITTVMVTGQSSTMSFGPNTTDIEVAAPNSGVALKWISVGNTNASVFTAIGTSNFDHIIPAGGYRKFVLPKETGGIGGIAQAGSIHGLYQRAAFAPLSGTSSVLVTEY